MNCPECGEPMTDPFEIQNQLCFCCQAEAALEVDEPTPIFAPIFEGLLQGQRFMAQQRGAA